MARFLFDIEKKKGGGERIRLRGPIDEDAEFQLERLAHAIGKDCVFCFEDVTSINSSGVRSWVNFMRSIQKDRSLAFENCVPEIVTQINLIPAFAGPAQIRSVIAHYRCDECNEVISEKFHAGVDMPAAGENAPLRSCPHCNGDTYIEEDHEEFFQFSRPTPGVAS